MLPSAVGREMKLTARLLVLFLLAGASIAACAGSDLSREAHPTTLTGTVWRVVAVNGRPSIPGSEPTAAFAETEVKGSAACNSYGGRYVYDPATGAIAFRDLGMTMMACAEPARNEMETIFAQAINQAISASIDQEGRLVLSGPGGEIVLAADAVGS
jgi:heat shock protein HslJ